MNSLRLLPVVMVVASSLLLFKIFGLVSGELYIFGSRAAIAQEAAAEAETAAPEADTATPDDKGAVAEAAESAMEKGGKPTDAMATKMNNAGKLEKLSEISGVSTTEIEFLERLRERRTALDEREKQLEIQESILQAAELRLETRANELKEIEARISALVDKKEAQEDEQFASLVTTYEAMKPKDAARIFNRLDMLVLVRLVERMNPKKFALVMAAMNDEKAEALTINLANPNLSELRQPVAEANNQALPQIIGQ